MNDHGSFGSWLKQQRKTAGLTQGELARRIGCALITIQKIEAGERRPSVQIAQRLAERLEIAPDERPAFLAWARREPPADHRAQPAESNRQAPWQHGYCARNNLPMPLTPLIGREREVAAVRILLLRDSVRLVTLSGAPGIGKTRLGIQVASELLGAFGDGVFFVALATIFDPALVAATIAQTLNIREDGKGSSWDVLRDALRNKHMLLVLDNFEQVLSAAPPLVELLVSCPRLKLLITSRAVLHLSGEHEFIVPPLALPDPGRLPPVAALARYAAVDLFVQRTQALRPDFTLTEANAPAVAEICVRLDGLPLAIELAAARSKLFAPQALLTRLTSRLKLLTGGAHDLPARQQTLRSTIDWSYDLLDESEQALFRQLGIFVGGCTLDAVGAICGSQRLDRAQGGHLLDPPSSLLSSQVLDRLTSLVDRSLLRQAEGVAGEPRFFMLETSREYALDRLAAHGETDDLRQQHARFFLALAEHVELRLHGSDQVLLLDRLEQDHDNMRTALVWLLESRHMEAGLRLAGALGRFWSVRGYVTEGRGWLEKLLAETSEQTLVRAKALHWAGVLASRQVDYAAAQTHYARSLALYRQHCNRQGIAAVLTGLGELAHGQGDYRAARQCFEESLALCRELDDTWGVTRALSGLGAISRDTGDNVTARALFEESLALCRALDDTWGIARLLYRLGSAAYYLGDHALEYACYQESLGIWQALGDKSGMAASLHNLGRVALNEGDYVAGHARLTESLALYQELGDKKGIAVALTNLGELARSLGNDAQAAAYYEEGLALYREMADKWRIAISLHNLGHVAHHQDDHRRAATLFHESLAVYRTLENRVGIAMCLAGLAGVAGTRGQPERAARLFGAAEEMLNASGESMYISDRIEYERNKATIRDQLGSVIFESLCSQGRTMPLADLIAEALRIED
ncbi:MAG TPA: tetratricopeptide repeat protein [Herpetosiphonaceae bacterium]